MTGRDDLTPPAPLPTRRTLVFPAIQVATSSRRRSSLPPPLPSRTPSDRPTVPTLQPAEVLELSTSALDSDPSLASVTSGLSLPSLPRNLFALVAARGALGQIALATLALVVATDGAPGNTETAAERVAGVTSGLRGPAREPHVAALDYTGLAARVLPPEPTAPLGGCARMGTSRTLASRAHLPPGIEVVVMGAGAFGVGFAASADEGLGVRLEGSPLRIADRVRVRSAVGAVKHVMVEGPRGEDEAIGIAIDGGDARTIVGDGEEAAGVRIVLVGGWVQAVVKGKGKGLWPVPGGGNANASASANASAKGNTKAKAESRAKGTAIVEALGVKRARGAKTGDGVERDGFVRLGDGAARAATGMVAPAVTTDLRAGARDEGGAVIALRRPSALWLGLVDRHLAADGPLVAVARAGAVIGMPAVAAWGTKGAAAWAERPPGERDFVVMVASFGGEGTTPTYRPVGAGMSPSIAALPDGDLLVAYAIGSSGAHRVVVRRLAPDLEPRGEAIVVSPEDVNAGQPAAAVGADGRGLVAFFGAERGQPASVLATPLMCGL